MFWKIRNSTFAIAGVIGASHRLQQRERERSSLDYAAYTKKKGKCIIPVGKVADEAGQLVVVVERLGQGQVVGLAPERADLDRVQDQHDAQPAVGEGKQRHQYI